MGDSRRTATLEEFKKTSEKATSTLFTASGYTSEETRREKNSRCMTNKASGTPLSTSLMSMVVIALGITSPDGSLSDVGHASGELSSTCRVYPIPDVMLRWKFLFICNSF